MWRPVSLRIVGVHGITRIHGGQKQKDIKSRPISDHAFFWARMYISLYVLFGPPHHHLRPNAPHSKDSLPFSLTSP